MQCCTYLGLGCAIGRQERKITPKHVGCGNLVATAWDGPPAICLCGTSCCQYILCRTSCCQYIALLQLIRVAQPALLFTLGCFLQYTFTACPRSGGPCVTTSSTDPDARFYNLKPSTQARLNGGQPGSVESPCSEARHQCPAISMCLLAAISGRWPCCLHMSLCGLFTQNLRLAGRFANS